MVTMEKWITFLITIMILNPTRNQRNDHGCSYQIIPDDGRRITCVNVTSDFFQYSVINLNRSHWLTCRNCNMTTITNDTFNFPKNTIAYLILIENNVMRVGGSAFEKLPYLKGLNLRNNLLTHLNPKTFMGIKRLLQLDLSQNYLTKLEDGVFLELENLDILNLNDNDIHAIDTNAFGGLLNLKYLYLNQNSLEKLNNNMFRHLPNLKILYLNNNRIKEIEPLAFNKLENLNYLYMNNNSIDYLVQYNFKPLTSLVDLQLRYNNLTEIETSTFNGLKSLKFLYLGQNSLAKIRPYGLIGLNALEVLDLIGNKFEYFTLDYFKAMENLNTLWLENNSIANFTIHYRSDTLESIKVVNLIHNKLAFFSYKLLYDKMPQLKEIWIGENPWKCDFVIEMYDYFTNNNVTVCSSTNCSTHAIESYLQMHCFDRFENETELTTGYSTDSTASNHNNCSFNFLLLVVLYYLLTVCKSFVVSTSF